MSSTAEAGFTMRGEIPTRDQIALEDLWDLSGIYDDESVWETDAARLPDLLETATAHRGLN